MAGPSRRADRETALCLPFPNGDCREIESRRCRHTLGTLPTVSAFKCTPEWDFSFQRQTFPFSSRTLHFEARLRSRPPSTSAQGAAGRPLGTEGWEDPISQ